LPLFWTNVFNKDLFSYLINFNKVENTLEDHFPKGEGRTPPHVIDFIDMPSWQKAVKANIKSRALIGEAS